MQVGVHGDAMGAVVRALLRCSKVNDLAAAVRLLVRRGGGCW